MIQVILIKPIIRGQKLGNHFHPTKTQPFTCGYQPWVKRNNDKCGHNFLSCINKLNRKLKIISKVSEDLTFDSFFSTTLFIVFGHRNHTVCTVTKLRQMNTTTSDPTNDAKHENQWHILYVYLCFCLAFCFPIINKYINNQSKIQNTLFSKYVFFSCCKSILSCGANLVSLSFFHKQSSASVQVSQNMQAQFI